MVIKIKTIPSFEIGDHFFYFNKLNKQSKLKEREQIHNEDKSENKHKRFDLSGRKSRHFTETGTLVLLPAKAQDQETRHMH